jgi:hypothetical protein
MLTARHLLCNRSAYTEEETTMDITVSNGKTYRVQFVHSGHAVDRYNQGAPGSRRQFVDNMSLSLRRRVSLCEISVLTNRNPRFEYNPLTNEVRQNTNVKSFDALSQGFALCHYNDQFDKKTGRKIALRRALKQSVLSVETRTDLAEACGFTLAELNSSDHTERSFVPEEPEVLPRTSGILRLN